MEIKERRPSGRRTLASRSAQLHARAGNFAEEATDRQVDVFAIPSRRTKRFNVQALPVA
jgi:hypothetical protein